MLTSSPMAGHTNTFSLGPVSQLHEVTQSGGGSHRRIRCYDLTHSSRSILIAIVTQLTVQYV